MGHAKEKAHRERPAVVVDRVEDGGARGEVEPGPRRVGLVHRDEVVRAAVGDRERRGADSRGLPRKERG